MSEKTARRTRQTQPTAIEQPPRYSFSFSPEAVMLLAQALTSSSFQNSASMRAAGEVMAQIEPIAQVLMAQAQQQAEQNGKPEG